LLRLPDVPGTPMLRDAAGEWFRDVVRAAFGSVDGKTGERFIREIFALIGKKNSKTSYAAALAVVWLLINERPAARGLFVGATQEIADLAYSQAEGMILLDLGLRGKRLRVQNHLKRISSVRTGATLEILSFDPAIVTGQKPSFWLLDELHVISKSAKAASALGQIRGGMISQPEALGVIISTQSEEPPAGVFRTELMKARAVRDGRDAVSRTLPVLYEFPDDIAKDRELWRNPANWPMVVPNDGRSITIVRLAQEFAVAEQSGAAELARWASQHLNIEVGLGLKTDAWPGAAHWLAQAEPGLTLDKLLERSEVVTVGVDGGGLDDMLGLALIGREKVTGRWLHWAQAWLDREAFDKRKSQAPKFADLERCGDLTVVDDLTLAFVDVADQIAAVNNLGLLNKAGFDPVGARLIVTELAMRGIVQTDGADSQVEGVSQGYKLTGTIKSTEVRLKGGGLVHCGQELMNYCVANARIELRGNAIIVSKQASGTAKIDPLMALFNAVALMLENPEAIGGPSVYDTAARAGGFLCV
jgi:phage terminase large subunit-like protein